MTHSCPPRPAMTRSRPSTVTHLAALQQLALLLVVSGLAVASDFILGDFEMAPSAWAGLGALFGSTVLHALVYVLQELTLVRSSRLPPAPVAAEVPSCVYLDEASPGNSLRGEIAGVVRNLP